MTVLFKLVPLDAPDESTIEVGSDDCGPRYYVKMAWDDVVGGGGVSRLDYFDKLEDALLRVAGNVKEGVAYYSAYLDPRPLETAREMGYVGARRQDAISGSPWERGERSIDQQIADAEEWRARGI